MNETIKIFDPRRSDDYVIGTRSRRSEFSSLAHGCLVIEGASFDWRSAASRLDALFGSRGEGFCYFRAWSPGSRQHVAAVTNNYEVYRRDGSVVMVRVAWNVGAAEQLLGLRERLGSRVSGIWAFGSTGSLAELDRCVDSNDRGAPAEYIFEQCLANVSAVLCLEEGEQSILLARLAAVEEREVDALLVTLEHERRARRDTV